MTRPARNFSPHYVVDGELGNAIPTVLIHGVGSDLRRWDGIAPELACDGPVIRYDLRGHGQSERPSGSYSLDDFIADHFELMGRLGVSLANVVGISLGGLIAQAITSRYPGSVARAVFISAIAGRSEAQRRAVLARLKAVEEGGPERVADGGERWFTEEFRETHPDVVRNHMQRFVANDPLAYASAFRVLATTDLVDELHDITVPTLIMTGSLDIGSPPAMAETMHERIDGSRVVIVEGVKHAILEEAPEIVASSIRSVLKQPHNCPNGPLDQKDQFAMTSGATSRPPSSQHITRGD